MIHHLVLLPHAQYPLLTYCIDLGRFGVDLFFVLSGFLITGILFRTKAEPSYFRTFYARRALRIFPLYYGYLAAYYFFVVRLHIVDFGSAKADEVATDLPWLWPYATNILIALRGNFITASLNHFWTLAVEEHFYVVWPLIVFLLTRRQLLIACVLTLLFSLDLRAGLLAHGVSGYTIATLTPCRLDGFAVGGWFALMRTGSAKHLLDRWAVPGMFIFFAGLGASLLSAAAALTTGYMCLAIAFGCLIHFSTAYSGRGVWGSVFRCRTLRAMGKYSYALYVLHFPIMIFFERVIPTPILAERLHSPVLGAAIHSAGVALVSVMFAVLSWHCYEKHFLGLKRYFEYAGPGKVPLQMMPRTPQPVPAIELEERGVRRSARFRNGSRES